jgi:predicted  nucleic acid-binding Zn-ribbon protein
MSTILAALKVALVSYTSELQHLTAEEENVRAYLANLVKRREKLEKEIVSIETELAGKEEQDGDPMDVG